MLEKSMYQDNAIFGMALQKETEFKPHIKRTNIPFYEFVLAILVERVLLSRLYISTFIRKIMATYFFKVYFY